MEKTKLKVELHLGDCLEKMKELDNDSIDLTVTSPPYDNLRTYNGNNALWGEHVWKAVIEDLYRVTKDGGVVVWVVGDATIKGSETGTSFKQVLWAKECGFNLHDTMIYHKNALPMNHNRYEQDFEYMFVWTKGKPKTFNAIRIPCKFPEKETARKNSYFSITDEKNRSARSGKKRKPVGKSKIKGNIWYILTGKGHSTKHKVTIEILASYTRRTAAHKAIQYSIAFVTPRDDMVVGEFFWKYGWVFKCVFMFCGVSFPC
jgi:site-specific DNA-methyltransferase (adenine-specific)